MRVTKSPMLARSLEDRQCSARPLLRTHTLPPASNQRNNAITLQCHFAGRSDVAQSVCHPQNSMFISYVARRFHNNELQFLHNNRRLHLAHSRITTTLRSPDQRCSLVVCTSRPLGHFLTMLRSTRCAFVGCIRLFVTQDALAEAHIVGCIRLFVTQLHSRETASASKSWSSN